ncbi:helix-turn-helix domain-containing protein [Halomicrococcus sp. SG-WS-1]|uniref:helix-turn-helix domain-containing protein n=1 Tax=Halomicrococcus sp. SG-WS-1 TaxID=3439057 RepID=UPI003F7A7F53
MVRGASNSDGSLDDAHDSTGTASFSDSTPSDPPKTLLAEIFVEHDDLLLADTIKTVPGVTAQVEDAGTASDTTFFVSVVGGEFGAFERALDEDPTVAEATTFTVAADKRVYRIRAASGVTRCLPKATELGIRILDVKSSDGGWVARVQMLSREPLIEFREACLEKDITFRVRQLYDADPTDESADVHLTGRQRNTLLTAYEYGYYDVPRGISQGELAEKLDISTSAISQQLRRATGQLIASTFAVDRD